jgi:hypothetical protein
MMATLVVRNANEALVAPTVGSGGVYVWRESGVRRSVLCLCIWQESGFSRREDAFTFNLVKEFYKPCSFNATCKDDTADKLYYCSTQKEIHSRQL